MFCFQCPEHTPTVEAYKTGTMVTLVQNCPNCGDEAFKWSSQPFGQSFGILMAGASVSEVLLVFRHMGVFAIRR